MVGASEISLNADVVAHLCVEYWKLSKATRKAVAGLPDGAGRRLDGQLNFSDRQLSMLLGQLGFRLIEFETEEFHAGLAASAVNAADYSDDVKLVVSKTLEPTIMADMKVIRLGRVLVEPAKIEKE